MTVATWGAYQEDGGLTYGILRGWANAGDPLRLLGVVLSVAEFPQQRAWLIDNRMVDEPLALADLAEFVLLASRHSEEFDDVSVAWVAPSPWDPECQRLAQQLSFGFHHFEEIDEAHRWLRVQLRG